MNDHEDPEDPTKKTIRMDAFTLIDTLVTGLTVLLGGLAVFQLPPEYSGPAALILVTLITMGKHLLGRSSQTTIELLASGQKAIAAKVGVLQNDAKPSTLQQANAAAAAVISPPTPPSGQ